VKGGRQGGREWRSSLASVAPLSFALALLAALLGPALAQAAQPHVLDRSFGDGGKVTTDFGGDVPARHRASRSPPAGTPPNIVLVLSDDQSYETERFMTHSIGPGWTSFKNAEVSTPLCCPSRATILSGQYAEHTGVRTNNDGWRLDDLSTLATWLSPKYRAGLFGKYLNYYPWGRGLGYVPPGWDVWHAFYRRPGYYGYELLSKGGRLARYGHKPSDYSTDVLANQTLRFIDQSAGGDRPFFAYYAPFGPHRPRTPAPRDQRKRVRHPGLLPNFNERNVSDKPAWIRRRSMVNARNMLGERRREMRTLLSVDDAVGRIVGTLRRDHELNNTVIIYLSDNGFSFGSHRYVTKNCVYEECVHVPLQMWLPGNNRRRVTTQVSNVDLASTITDLAGVQTDIPQDGRSLLPFILRGASTPQRRLLLQVTGTIHATHAGWGVRSNRYKYSRLKSGEKELYDLRKDPFEMKNRIHNRHYRDVKRKLADWLRKQRSS
jgi:N-acetylglucosamine-6-sulfatase